MFREEIAWSIAGTLSRQALRHRRFFRLELGRAAAGESRRDSATAGRVLDGTSLAPLLFDESVKWNSATLLQCTQAAGVATRHYRYVTWFETGEVELYDLSDDPFELRNVAGKTKYAHIQADLAAALAALQGCAGTNCAWSGHFPPPPK